MGKWTEEQKKEFDDKSFILATKAIPEKFPQEATKEELDETHNLMKSLWLSAGKARTKQFPTVADALADFQRWIVAQYHKHGQSENEYIEMTVQFDYGQPGGIVTWKTGSQFVIRTPNDRNAASISLYGNILGMKSEFERHYMLSPAHAPKAAPNQPPVLDVVACSRLVIDLKDGVKYYKVKGGRWEKHGVRIWPEVMKRAKIDPESVPLEGLDLEGWDMHVEMEGEKAVVVKALAHG